MNFLPPEFDWEAFKCPMCEDGQLDFIRVFKMKDGQPDGHVDYDKQGNVIAVNEALVNFGWCSPAVNGAASSGFKWEKFKALEDDISGNNDFLKGHILMWCRERDFVNNVNIDTWYNLSAGIVPLLGVPIPSQIAHIDQITVVGNMKQPIIELDSTHPDVVQGVYTVNPGYDCLTVSNTSDVDITVTDSDGNVCTLRAGNSGSSFTAQGKCIGNCVYGTDTFLIGNLPTPQQGSVKVLCSLLPPL